MSKKIFKYFIITILYFGIGILLQQCAGWNCGKDVKDYQINQLDWIVGNHYGAAFPDTLYVKRDSAYIHTRLLDFHYVETASLFQLLPTALACSPLPPRSVQSISGLSITLLDSVKMATGNWLAPNTLVNGYFIVLMDGIGRNTATNFLRYSERRFESTDRPFSLVWNEDLAEPSSMRLQIKMELSDGKRFETPENQPIQLNIY